MAILEAVVMMALPYVSPRQTFFWRADRRGISREPIGAQGAAAVLGASNRVVGADARVVAARGRTVGSTCGVAGDTSHCGALIGFVQAYFRVRPHGLASDEAREAELTPVDDGMPR